jgi:hypothetical protein
MAGRVFAPLADRARYASDGVTRIQETLSKRGVTERETSVSTADVAVTSTTAETLTASQWAAIKEIRNISPDATVVLRMHTVSWKKDPTVAVPCFGILVTQRLGPFTLRREFDAPRSL